MFGAPFAVRGMFFEGTFSHWAETGASREKIAIGMRIFERIIP
jgi:hypothetical protein